MPAMLSYPPPSKEIEIISAETTGTTGTHEIKFKFLPTVRLATVKRLIRELPEGRMLQFYDREYPSPSDPGAMFSVMHGESGGYIMSCGNHGWGSGWEPFEAATVIQYLWGCRFFNMDAETSVNPWIGFLYVDDDLYRHLRRRGEGPSSYFVHNVARRLQGLQEMGH